MKSRSYFVTFPFASICIPFKIRKILNKNQSKEGLPPLLLCPKSSQDHKSQIATRKAKCFASTSHSAQPKNHKLGRGRDSFPRSSWPPSERIATTCHIWSEGSRLQLLRSSTEGQCKTKLKSSGKHSMECGAWTESKNVSWISFTVKKRRHSRHWGQKERNPSARNEGDYM